MIHIFQSKISLSQNLGGKKVEIQVEYVIIILCTIITSLCRFLSSNYMNNEVCATDQAINQRKRLDLTCFEVYFIKTQCFIDRSDDESKIYVL